MSAGTRGDDRQADAGATPPPAQLNLPASLADAIVEHARREAPVECCGLLLGVGRRVDQVWPARNTLASPTAFSIDPADHFAALAEARRLGWHIIGAYHSHPATPATPSPRDLADSVDTSLVHVIVSLLPGVPRPEMRAYRLEGRNFTEVSLVLGA